jgi:hypothetical protein
MSRALVPLYRRTMLMTVAALIVAVVATTSAQKGSDRDREDDDRGERRDASYAIGLWGDLPYSDLQATFGVPNLIKDMNRQDHCAGEPGLGCLRFDTRTASRSQKPGPD